MGLRKPTCVTRSPMSYLKPKSRMVHLAHAQEWAARRPIILGRSTVFVRILFLRHNLSLRQRRVENVFDSLDSSHEHGADRVDRLRPNGPERFNSSGGRRLHQRASAPTNILSNPDYALCSSAGHRADIGAN